MNSTTLIATSAKPVLLTSRNFVLLWLGQAISQLGDTIFNLTTVLWAAVILAHQASWAPLAVSALMIAQIVPMFLVGPLAGVFVDRWDKRQTMLWMDLLRALLLVPLLFVTGFIHLPFLLTGPVPSLTQLGIVVAVVFLASSCSQFFSPSRIALTADIVAEEQRARATSLEQITGSLSLIFGPVLAAPLLFGFGIGWALLINSLSFVLSLFTIFAMRPPASARSVIPGQRGHLGHELWQGLRFSFQHRVIRSLIIGSFIVMLGIGAYNTLYVFLFLQNLHVPPALIGLLDAFFGVGIIVGAVFSGLFAQRIGLERLLTLSVIVGGLAVIALARMTSMLPGSGVILLLGICQGCFSVTFGPLMLKVTPRELVGRVSALLNPIPNLSTLIAVVLAGYLASTVLRGWHAVVLGVALGPLDTIFMGAGLLILLAGFYLLKNLRVQ